MARQCMAVRGMARRGRARINLSVLRLTDHKFRFTHGMAMRGKAWQGAAGRGRARDSLKDEYATFSISMY
jgi:hypothetical protein